MHLMSWLRLQWDRTLSVGLVVLGFLVVLVGWLGVSDQIYPAAQLPYLLSGGVLGILLIGVGATVWLSADMRDEWRKLARVEEQLDELNRRLYP